MRKVEGIGAGASLFRALRDAGAFFLPPGCLGCGGPLPSRAGGALVCPSCRSRLRPPPWPRCPRCHAPRGTGRSPGSPCLECSSWPPELTFARSAVLLEHPGDRLVHAFKYRGWRRLGRTLARKMESVPLPESARPTHVPLVPVPTTSRRRRRRGYNQARILAEALAQLTERPLLDLLSRLPGASTQVSLHRAQRRANVRGVFFVRDENRGEVPGRHFIVVDDVLTTGSTGGAVARALGDAGATGVTLLTFARALP